MWERLLSGKFVSLYEKNGYNITLRIEKIMWGDQMGSFGVSKKNGTLKIMTFNGFDESSEELDPYTLVHEFGHMVHYAFDIKKGSNYVKKKWDACGTGVYVSDYAASGFREDFAETFACIATDDYSQAGLLEAIDNDKTGVLKKKVECIDSLLGEFVNFTTIQKMYGFGGIGASCGRVRVSVNGKITEVFPYNIKGNNYFKIRDLAMLLRGTEKQFEVSWDPVDQAVVITSGVPYTVTGGELSGSPDYRAKANPATSMVYINGDIISPTVYNIHGYNNLKLRDIATALDFRVDWESESMTIIIDTTAGYVE